MADPMSCLALAFALFDEAHIDFNLASEAALQINHHYMVGRLLTRNPNFSSFIGSIPMAALLVGEIVELSLVGAMGSSHTVVVLNASSKTRFSGTPRIPFDLGFLSTPFNIGIKLLLSLI
ncbi:hypothetical protein RchiOBHm_Chr2g0123951 [Rosa chinensis]|uniref:Uncharacterized protein n=1 Tax=Rosa chinensis TaxID=74649 RepID=A0A2P6RT56_ROSCH|nr:hypothetical protein RchiOBHm_Chr2g0123951 [Rosa chinensis]